jgi:hypothetical protein
MLTKGFRPGPRLTIAVIPLAFLVVATIPFVRWAATRSESGGLTAAFTQAVQDPGRAAGRFILGPDTAMVPALAIEMMVLKSPGDYFFGRATFGDLLLAPIPHILIPGKPQTARDEFLTRAFGMPCTVTAGGVCDDFSIVGTFYQDFWVPGVAILMGIVGGALGILWAAWRRRPDNPLLLVSTAILTVFIPIIFRAGFMPAFVWSLYFLVPCLLGVAVSGWLDRWAGHVLGQPKSG